MKNMENSTVLIKWGSIPRRTYLLFIIGWLICALLLVGVDLSRYLITQSRVFSYQEGDTIEKSFIIEEDFSFVDKQATQKLIQLNRSLVNPVFVVSSRITESVLHDFDRFATYYTAVLENRDSGISITNFNNQFPGSGALIDVENSRTPDEIGKLLEKTRQILENLQHAGIFRMNPNEGSSASGIIEVVYAEDSPDQRVAQVSDFLVHKDNISEYLRSLDSLAGLNDNDREFLIALTLFFAETNAYRSQELTRKSRDETERATIPVSISLSAGTRLLNAGGIVTMRQAQILEALRNRRGIGFNDILEPFLFMGIIFLFGFIISVTFQVTLPNRRNFCLCIALWGTYLLIAGILNAFVHNQDIFKTSLMLPTALFTLLLSHLLRNRNISIVTSLCMALLVFFLTSWDTHNFFITIAAGFAGTVAIKRRETRMGLLCAGPRIALIMSVITFITAVLTDVSLMAAAFMALIAAANGLITGILSLAFLPLLEHLLNMATTFRLIELSDQNIPILKRMRLQAPGTYIHSQNVAHLAEAACEAIGADGLLARVGAYFHDVGKVDQANYFVENQSGENLHDDMKASLSATVIKSHVSRGMEKARELRLPNEVLEVIEQHHGTSVISYFYNRAVQEQRDSPPDPEDYSYGGPKPQSPEAAVVMLADSAEAATRTLKNPTVARLEKFVWELMMTRFKDGELNHTSLTLKDLETIKKTFVQVLTGHFHSRVEYPQK